MEQEEFFNDVYKEISKQIKGLYVSASNVLAFDEYRKIFIHFPFRIDPTNNSGLSKFLKEKDIMSEPAFLGGVRTSVANHDLIIWKKDRVNAK